MSIVPTYGYLICMILYLSQKYNVKDEREDESASFLLSLKDLFLFLGILDSVIYFKDGALIFVLYSNKWCYLKG